MFSSISIFNVEGRGVVCLFVCLFICLFVCLFVCLFDCFACSFISGSRLTSNNEA